MSFFESVLPPIIIVAGVRRENLEADLDHRVDVIEAILEDIVRDLRICIERFDGIEERIKKIEE